MRGQQSSRLGVWSQLRREIRSNRRSRHEKAIIHLTRKDLIKLVVIAIVLLLMTLLATYLVMNYKD